MIDNIIENWQSFVKYANYLKLNDKENLNIFDLYLEEARRFKTEEMIKDMGDPSKWAIPMYNFFAKTSTPNEVIRLSKYYSEILKETAAHLERGKVIE